MIKLLMIFMYIGTVSIGGGLATIPFLVEEIVGRGFISMDMLYTIIAVSESTPGPIGINMSTFIGFNEYGIIGGILCSIALVLPSFIIIILITNAYEKYKKSRRIHAFIKGLRVSVVGLIFVIVLDLINHGFIAEGIDYMGIICTLIMVGLIKKYDKNPIIYILLGALIGIVLY